ncbi:alpha/beta fold hydrolase [Corynebacterium xerosis]|uniref:Alpha/beta hydrolase n=1 Tax=Corynebacterium xerosis TaxID=1725 RepID=A0A7X9XT95_9CORY|nr:hypothetical protein [Corynebacterium xerosis]NMF09288.1 hypothetical protein [Corynebacterium xerosis]
MTAAPPASPTGTDTATSTDTTGPGRLAGTRTGRGSRRRLAASLMALSLASVPLLAAPAMAQPAGPDGSVGSAGSSGSAGSAGSSAISVGPEGIGQAPVDSPVVPVPAGTIRADFGAPGPHAITVTKEARACDDLIHDLYADVVEATMNVHERPSCYDTFPGGTDSPIGVQFYYPTGVAEGTVASAPLMILSPGVGANAGKIDFSRTMLVGQSAGGGSVARMGGLLDGALNGYRDVDFRTAGFVAIMPGPADFGTMSPPSSVPALFTIAEHESLVPWPLSRPAYDRHQGPAWWTVVKGTSHGSYLDDPKYTAYGALVLSFSTHVMGGGAPGTDGAQSAPDASAVYVGEDYRLASDPELMMTERKG